MITAISTIKTTIKTHITTTWLATRGALIALFAGLFILAACGGGGGGGDDVVDSGGGAACTNPFAEGCGDAGATLRATAITACRVSIEKNEACANTIPDAVITCLTDPYKKTCDEAAYTAAIRTPVVTVTIGALQTGRTDSCRGRTVAGARLCDGAIDNTCLDLVTSKTASRNQLVLDNLCNNAPNYIDARTDFVADCTDGDRLNNAGCTSRITTCTNTPFSAECRVDVYDSYRAVACRNALEGTANARCRSENIIATYCGANAFVTTAGCLADEDFDDVRIADCIIGDNVRQPRCKNETTFSTSGLIACFENPYGDGCDTALGSSFDNAQNNRENYCTRLGARADGNPLCDAAILNVCTGDDANIFDPLCFAENYQTARVMTCSATDSEDASRCTATVAQICTDNPFTQTVGGTAGDLCTDADARVAFVARCASGNQTVCGAVSVGAVTLKNCIDNPYDAGCGDDAFNDLKAARYDHCTSDTASLKCMGVESLVCISDSEKANPLANPFLAVCRNSKTPYAGIQTAFCTARMEDNIPECVQGFRDDCNDDPFTTACLASKSFATDRAVIIADCVLAEPNDPAKCALTIDDGTTTVAMCATNPFDTTNGCNDNTGFDAARDARTALCSATGTPFDTLCEDFPGKDAARTTHCTTDETLFNALCLDAAYPMTRTLRESFCSQPANRFLVKCTNVAGVSDARATLVLLCSTNPEASGCDQPANGISGATLAQCGADPSNTANGCNELVSFQPVRDSRTALCQTRAADGHSPYDPLCDNFDGIDMLRDTYCTSTTANDGGSFDANCVLDYPDGVVMARRAFALLCREPPVPAACATTFVVKGVSVADCIKNPYKRECSGTEAMPNPDFAAEVSARNELCTSGNIYSDLCLLNGEEIIEGVEAARIAGCTTPAQSAFNPSCTETAYPGTEDARSGYCSTRDSLSPDDSRICTDYEASICGAGADANPFALLCTEGGKDNSENQMTFCGLPQNLAGAAARTPQCTNDATLICPIDPFNETAGIDGTVNCLMDDGDYAGQRATRCAAGTQGTGVCNKINIVTRVCIATGGRANPFAEFCKEAVRDDEAKTKALETAKTTFANACAGASPSVHCETPDVKTALCSVSGDFLRPFADTCTGEEDISETRVSFCGTGNNVTAEPRCNAIIVSVCRDDPFSSGCETTGESYIAELRDLRAEHCESLTVADALCSAEAVTAVCEGYTAASGVEVINPLSGLCAGGYATERRDACLNIASEARKNAVCDTISAVEEACRPTPFNVMTPGCAFISQADDLQEAYCVATETTWQDACDTLAGASGGVNTVDTARRDSCLDLDSDRRSPEACKALESVGDACEANPFEKTGCNVFAGPTLIGYELAYCSLTATAWEDGCNDLVDTQSAVATARTQACTLLAVVPTNAGSKCNDVLAVTSVCEDTPLASNFLGCKFLDKFEEYVTDYCTGSTTWEEVCDVRAGLSEGNNDIFRARRTACLASADVPSFPDDDCAEITINYCGDTDNSANALDAGCMNADYMGTDTTLEKQRQKACAEGGMNAVGDDENLCMDQVQNLAKVYCTTIDPYAGTGCEELAGDQDVINFRASYCDMNSGEPECGDVDVVCMANPFDGRCVDESPSETYATARETRANDCRAKRKTGADCLGRVTTCNSRPFSATAAHFPVGGAATTCSTDPAFADARADFITKCIVVNAVQTDQDCKNVIADQKVVSTTSCLENPYADDVLCAGDTQLGSDGNVATAKNSYCRATTGGTSFVNVCGASNGEGVDAEIIQARVDSCLASASPINLNATCDTLITGFCTDTTGGAAADAFDVRCDASEGDYRDGTATARATLCVNGTEHENCPTIGASFTAWTNGDTADTEANILDAGEGTTDKNANFIKGVLNANDTLYVGKDSLGANIIATTKIIRLNHDYTGDEASATPLSGDEEDGFVYAHADVADDGVSRFFVGILHTTDLGAPITDTTGKALWKGVIQAFRYDGNSAYIHNADFVLEVNFATPTIDFYVNTNGVITRVVTLAGQDGVSFSITSGTFNRTTGLITGTVLLADNASGSTKETTALLRGVIGADGAVGVFASESPNTGDFGDFVGGFVASARDNIPVCPIETDPFGRGCNRNVPAVLTAQFLACSTGVLPNTNPVTAADCNHPQLSYLICNDETHSNSPADPFAQICTDPAITDMNKLAPDTIAAREAIRAHCEPLVNADQEVCTRRVKQLERLAPVCIRGNEADLFGARCKDYAEYRDLRAGACRERDALSTLTCNTAEIIALVCAAEGVAANPFDTICFSPTPLTYGGARKTFAARCAVQRANDSRGQRVLKGADCSDSGLNSDCLDHPFTTVGGCNADVDYDTVRSDRISICREISDINLFDYNCFGAIEDVCGDSSAPTDAVLFNDKLCLNDKDYDTRRAAIVLDCVSDKADTNAECVVEAAAGINIISCIDQPYQAECAAAAFGDRRTAVLGDCDTTFTIGTGASDSVNCVDVQISVCGAGIYAGDPFAPFCDKKDTTNSDATIAPETLADGRNKHCQIGTNATSVPGCAEFLARPTTAALLNANSLGKSPNTTGARNQFLRGTADGLNTGGFIRKDGQFAFVSTLNLNTATYGTVALGGDAADGVAYFAGREHITQGDIITDVNYYAGIHSGTDLGAPLPRQYGAAGEDVTVNWNGRIGWLIYDENSTTDGYAFDRSSGRNGVTDFTLTINLTQRSVYAHIVRMAALSGSHGFLLEGGYDTNGVIEGTAKYGPNGGNDLSSALYEGFLIGLIGEEGAVGAFHLTGSGQEATQGASGGFVVSPSAAGSDQIVLKKGTFNYWIAERVARGGKQIDVLETAEEIRNDSSAVNFIVAGSSAQGAIALGGAFSLLEFSTGSSDGLGFGYSSAEKFYVGLLPSTDLGAPRTETADSPSVFWNGLLSIAKQDGQGTDTDPYLIEEFEFKLKITFTGNGIGTITTSDADGDRINLPRSIYGGDLKDEFAIDGDFDEFGLIRGRVRYYAKQSANLRRVHDGILTGLIGAEGLAGIFTSEASGDHLATVGHYVGGFVASSSFGLGGADTWQENAVKADGTAILEVKDAKEAERGDDEYTFIRGGEETLLLGTEATKSDVLTQDVTFDTDLILDDGDVFSLNSPALGGISFAQADVGAGAQSDTQFYAGLLTNTFVGTPLTPNANVDWRGVISIIAGDTPTLYTTNFRLAINFNTKTVFSTTDFLQTLNGVIHNIELSGKFSDTGVIYGTATYQVGSDSNEGELTGLIGQDGAVAVFGGGDTDSENDAGRFVGGIVAVPGLITSVLIPHSTFVWAAEIDEAVFADTRFDKSVASTSPDDNTITLRAKNAAGIFEETVITDADAINLDTTFVGGRNNADRTEDGFVVFQITNSNTRHVGILSGTNLGGPVVDTGGTGEWHARMAGFVISSDEVIEFETNFTLNVDFDLEMLGIGAETPSFQVRDAGSTATFNFSFANIGWNPSTGFFTGPITLSTTVDATTTEGVLRGIIGADGAVATLKVSAEAGSSTRAFIGGFVAVPEAIGAARGQTSYWAEYARNADNTAGLDVRGVRGAKTGDGIYTVIEGGYETLELGVAVAKNTDPDLTYDLTFANTEKFPDGSSFNIDSTVAGGISFIATEKRFGKYYAGLLSGTDVGRLLSRRTPTATWVGRFGVIYGTTSFDNTLRQKDFELVIDFDARTLKSHNPDDTASLTDADAISFLQAAGFSYELIIDGEYNDRGIIYGTTTLQDNDGSALSNVSAGTLTGLIGQKGAAAVFHRTSGNIRYVGGFVAVPDRGDFTQVYDNIPASHNVWAIGADTTPQQDTNSGSALASATNTAAFTTEEPAVADQTTPFSLNLATFGGDAGDGFIGYGTASARHIGVLSSINLGGLNLNTGTATWTGVLRLIIGNDADVVTQNFTLNVAFGDRTIGLADDFAFMRSAAAYTLTLVGLQWEEDSGLVTGTVNIIPDATPGDASVGDVRGLIGADGLVAAFRSTDASHSSFTGGFVAAEARRTKTSFTDYFSSEVGGELLEETVNDADAKFVEVSDDNKLLLDNNTFASSAFYKLGASTVNTGSSPSGFIYSTSASHRAVGLLNTTNLGAPLPLILAKTVEWTGKLFRSNDPGTLATITLVLNFAEGTIKTKAPSMDIVRIDGYFGLNPLALAADLPLGFLAGKAVYHRDSDPMETVMTLIGQIGQKGVVGIFRGEIKNNGPTSPGAHVFGGFTALSLDTTANAREFITRQGLNTADGVDQIDVTGSAFQYANKDGNIYQANPNYRFGLGGDNTPSVTNPNGFTIGAGGFGLSVGIWADADLGLLLPQTVNAFATWTGKIHTLRYNAKSGGRRTVAAATVESDFTIQVNFEGRKISTVSAVDALGAVTLGAVDLTGGETFRFLNVDFDANGIIGCTSSCPVEYTIAGITYGLNLVGVIGEKGALGIFRGAISKSNTGNGSLDISNVQNGPGIAGGFQVIPTARVIKVAPPPRVVITTPAQLNYKAYLDYYQTKFIFGPDSHGPGVRATPSDDLSQFLQSDALGTGLLTGMLGLEDPDHLNFAPFTVYLNGEDKSTPNGFVLASGTSVVTTLRTRYYAGLLAGADVGRFTDALVGTTVLWSGSFYSSAYVSGTTSGNRAPARFPITLTVDFSAGSDDEGTEGTIGTNGLDVVLLNGHSVNIAGTFGFVKGNANQGIIGGEITYTAPNTDAQKLRTTAPLYGIIGDAGALAVFAGGLYPDVQGAGSNISPLVGGFEVSPNPVPTASYQVFEDYFSGLDEHIETRVYSKIGDYSTLLKGTPTGLVQDFMSPPNFAFYVQRSDQTHAQCRATRNCNILTSQVVRLGEDERSNSGFVIMTQFDKDHPGGDIYAGLLSGTNLGAILPVRFARGNTTAIWHGSIYESEDAIEISTGVARLIHYPLSLTVDLAAGTLRTVNLLGNLGAFVLSPSSSVTIDGRFGLNARTAKLTYGLLIGDVWYNGRLYRLAGLIGVEGAIGVFARDIDSNSGNVSGNMPHGGFQVSPPPPPAYGRGEYAVFEDFYIKRAETDDRYLEASRTANTDQFVRGLRTGLVAPAEGDLTTGFAPLPVYLGGDADSGNAFIIENFNGTHVVGLLGTTDLGFAPHAGLASATWEGTFYVSNNVASTGTDAPAPFAINAGVEVDFGAGTLTSTQAEYELANDEFISFGIFGEFGRIHELPLGILDGIVKYGKATTSELLATTALRELPLIGVIGRAGALGIFRDPSDNNFVGGFEAGIVTNYEAFNTRAINTTGFDPRLGQYTSSNKAIIRAAILPVNADETGLTVKNTKTDTDIEGFVDEDGDSVGDRYGLNDDDMNPNGFILASGVIETFPHPLKAPPAQTATELRIVGAGFLPTTNLGAVILDTLGSATWEGKAYVIDHIDTTTKIFDLTFKLNFTAGTFRTDGAVAVTSKIGADGAPVPITDGQTGQTLRIAGLFGQGITNKTPGRLEWEPGEPDFEYNDGTATRRTTAFYGAIGRRGAVGVFQGGDTGGNYAFAGGFWAGPSATTTDVKHDAFVTHYDAVITDTGGITVSTTAGTAVAFTNTSPADDATSGLQSKSFFELGEGTSDETVTDGLFAYVYSNVKVIGITDTTDLGAVQPITTPSATWLGRVFVKSDATAFSTNNNQRQVGLKVNFAEGTIDTVQPASFTIGAKTHSLSVRGRFGLHSFARGSDVPSASGLLSGFVTYTHHGQKAANFELIGLIGADGALGVFKGRVTDNGVGVGVIGGFEASPDTATYLPKYTTYIEQFKGSINDTPKGGELKSQISKGQAQKLAPGGVGPVYEPTFRLGGSHSDANTAEANTNIVDGFAMIVFPQPLIITQMHKTVGILSGTDLGMPVTSNTETATWAGRLYVKHDYGNTAAAYAALNLRVNFGEGTLKTLQPITIVAYKEVVGNTPSVRKQTLTIEGRFGSHLDAFGLRTGILGGSVIYNVGHLTPKDNASTEYNRHSITTAHLPLLGLIGEEGAIGVFHGSVGSDVHIIGGFEVSPRAAPAPAGSASFEHWAQGASECGAINLTRNTINLRTECPLGAHTPIVFAHPNDLFEVDDDLTDGVRPVSKGFVLGSDKATGIDFSSALSTLPTENDPSGVPVVRVLTLGGDNFADGTFVDGDTFFSSTGKRFTINTPQAMGEDGSADGIAFVTHYGSGTTFYAGLLSTTDLGAPLTMTSGSSIRANWPGRFVLEWYDAVYDTSDFVLDIDFMNSTISTAGVNVANLDWTLEGRYDASGIITGIIKNTAVNVTRIGTLTGLIGAQGAVATFIIDEEASNANNISYVGGFVAAPVGTTRATAYGNFSDHYTAQLNADLAAGERAGFASSLADGSGLDTTTAAGKTFATTTALEFNEVFLLGGAQAGTNGFTLLRGTLTIAEPASTEIRYRAGLLSGADVGPLVSADVNGLWTGTGIVATTTNAVNKYLEFNLILNVDFSEGTITSANDIYVQSGSTNEYLRIFGTFGAGNMAFNGAGGGTKLPPGILGGEAYHRVGKGVGEEISEMPLIGLIGGDGAIGVFYEQTGNVNFAVAGGFTAQPFALTPAGIAAAMPPGAVDVNVLQDYATLPTTGSTTSGGFLKLGNTFTNAIADGLLPTDFMRNLDAVSLRNDIEDIGGVGYFSITETDGTGESFYYYAGILAGTDLGGPRDETAGVATWTGKFSEHNSRASTDDFIKFHINFGLGELQFLNAAGDGGGGTLTRGDIMYTLNGQFGNGFADANNNIITTGLLGGRITAVSGVRGQLAAPISGLIGEKGVVGAFANPDNEGHFAGGFWAVPVLKDAPDVFPLRVTFSDWADDFGRATPPPTTLTTNNASKFLTGKATLSVRDGPNEVELDGVGLNEFGTLSQCCRQNGGNARFALTFGKDGATYGGKPLGGGGTAADGVAGFAAGTGNDIAAWRYVGFLSGTNLGAPISAGTPVGAWYGRFVGIRRTGTGSFLYRTLTDFTLTVTYTDGGGGTLSMGNIGDSNTSSDDYYTMVGGKFDGTGVISGALNYQRRANGSSTLGLLTRGILTGLIGVDGAVGGFIGGAGTIDAITAHGSTDSRFFGGFVAGPAYVPPMGTTEFLLENALDGNGVSMTIPTVAGTNLYNFITAGATELNLTNATNKNAVKLSDLSGNDNSTSGFAIETTSPGGVTRRHVGILDDTDVGAPLTLSTNITADWTGMLAIQAEVFSKKAITLNVGFDGTTGTITTQHGGFYYATTTTDSDDPRIVINGKFGANGVIYGTTSATNTSAPLSTAAIAGTLTGLIGRDGVVAVFAGNNVAGNYGYAGGFVATPKPAPACATTNCVDYADWATTTTPDVVDGFVTEHKFATSAGSAVLTNQLAGTSISVYDTSAGGDVSDGFGYYHSSGYYYVGILATTNLGAPLDMTTAEGIWSGEVTVVESNGSIASVETYDFTLGVTFGATLLGNAGSVASGTIGTTDITFEGEFDANGVIIGTTASTANGAGVVQGLIGAEGAVGAFHSTKTGNGAYAGGFIAKPAEPDVSYAAWESSFDTGGVNESATSPLRDSGFTNAVRGTSDYIKLDGDTKIVTSAGTFTPNILRLNDTVGEPGYESGIAYRNVSVTGSLGQTYAGILPTTNLGAPLVDDDKDGTWTGRLRGITGFAEPSLFEDSFSLKVTWVGTSPGTESVGTIESLDVNGDVGFAPVGGFDKGMKFTGDFNALGVMWGDVKANINDVDPDNGTFSGLIGAKGAVGVFEGVSGVFSYSGGFEVKHVPSN